MSFQHPKSEFFPGFGVGNHPKGVSLFPSCHDSVSFHQKCINSSLVPRRRSTGVPEGPVKRRVSETAPASETARLVGFDG